MEREWSASHLGRFTPGWGSPLPEWATEPVWTVWRREKSRTPTGIRPPDRPARNADYDKKPGAKDVYQQLQHFTHTVYSCTYNDSHNKYQLCAYTTVSQPVGRVPLVATDDPHGVGQYVLTIRTSRTLKSAKYNKTGNVCTTYQVEFVQPLEQWKSNKHYIF